MHRAGPKRVKFYHIKARHFTLRIMLFCCCSANLSHASLIIRVSGGLKLAADGGAEQPLTGFTSGLRQSGSEVEPLYSLHRLGLLQVRNVLTLTEVRSAMPELPYSKHHS